MTDDDNNNAVDVTIEEYTYNKINVTEDDKENYSPTDVLYDIERA